jgi:hypothetical protein
VVRAIDRGGQFRRVEGSACSSFVRPKISMCLFGICSLDRRSVPAKNTSLESLMKKTIFVVVLIATAASAPVPARALPLSPLTDVATLRTDGLIELVRARGFHRPHGGGPRMGVGRPGVGVGRPGVGVGRPIARPGVGRVGVGYLHRPWTGRYWRPGVGWVTGSVVAVGVLSAAAAVAYAPPPPAPGYCWYYTDPSYRAGYWALCQ